MSKPIADQIAAGVQLPDFFHYLGMSVIEASAAQAVVRMEVPKELRSPFGPAHGGAIAALIDTAIGIAVACRIAPPYRTATHELNINYITFAREPVIISTARVLRLGQTVAHAEADAKAEDGSLVAKALATFGVVRRMS